VTSPEQTSIRHRTIIGTIWMIAWRGVSRVLGLGSTLILARLLAPSDFGLIAMATTFAAAIEGLWHIGISEALIRRPDNSRAVLDTAFTLQVLRAVVSALVIAAAAPWAGAWFHEPRLVSILYVLAFGTLVAGCENIGIVEFRRNLQQRLQIRMMMVPRVLQVAACIALALTLRSYWALPLSLAFGQMVRVVMTYAMHPHRPRLTLSCWQELASFSLWTWIASLVRIVWRRADSFILGPVLGARSFGLYLLGTEIALLPITELIEPAVDVLFPGISAARNSGTKEARLVPEIIGVMLLPILPLAIGFSASANCLTSLLLGSQWSEATPIIAIMAASCVASPFAYVCFITLMARGAVRRDFNVMSVATLVRCGLIYAAALSLDVRMAAWAALASAVIEAVLFIVEIRKVDPPDFAASAGSFARMAAAAALVIALLYLSGLGWQQTLPSIGMAVVQGGAIACIALAVFGAAILGMWHAAGRPEGAELRGLHLLETLLRARAGALTRRLADATAMLAQRRGGAA
jgi:O-antigen/teichoic acid export membrane protein